MAAAGVVFDAEVLSREDRIPVQFVWPAEDRAPPSGVVEEIAIPVVDLGAFLRGRDGDGELPRGVAEACERHGFFQVVNHGVPAALLADAYRCLDAFFARPLADKQRAQRRPGESHGYASSFTGRFQCCLPWKETLSFNCPAGDEHAAVDYFVDVLGEDYRHMGYSLCSNRVKNPGVLRRHDAAGAGGDGGARGGAGPAPPRRAAWVLRRRRLRHAAEPLPSVPAAAPDAGHGPAPGPDVAHAAAPGRRRRPAGARRHRRWRRRRGVARCAAPRGRVRGQHRGHLRGAHRRAPHQLPPPRRGQRRPRAQVARLLPQPAAGPRRPAAGRAPWSPGEGEGTAAPARVPGLHVARVPRVHAEALPVGRQHHGRLRVVDRRRCRPWRTGGGQVMDQFISKFSSRRQQVAKIMAGDASMHGIN